MKKTLIYLIFLFLIIIISIYFLKIITERDIRNLSKYNYEYEKYLNRTIYGAELATLINKTVDLNEKNKIEKDEQKHFIDNKENSIKIDIKILLTKKTYPMEEFYNNDTAQFVEFFDLEQFKCVNIEYHKKTNKVSKLVFEQIEK